MQIGFLTGCLGDIPLMEKAGFAAKAGFQSLEISCWPIINDRDYAGSDIDVCNLNKQKAGEIRSRISDLGLTISSLAYYDNNLSADLQQRKLVNNHSRAVIDAAEMLDVPLVGLFIGKDHTKGIEDNFGLFEKIFGGLVGCAENKGVKIMIENCHMPDWQEPGKPGTISYSPELWEEMFARIPSKSFGLNFDPSHLHLMLMDYMECVKGFEDRIFYLHAKDAEVFPDKINRFGIYDGQLKGESFGRYRMPSLGQIDWKRLISHFKDYGYDGVISIEHEDHMYDGSEEKIKEGLLIALEHLKKIV